MQNFLLFLIAYMLFFNTFVYLNDHKGAHEEITEAQYREQSLQYLEDIRNSLDEK